MTSRPNRLGRIFGYTPADLPPTNPVEYQETPPPETVTRERAHGANLDRCACLARQLARRALVLGTVLLLIVTVLLLWLVYQTWPLETTLTVTV